MPKKSSSSKDSLGPLLAKLKPTKSSRLFRKVKDSSDDFIKAVLNKASGKTANILEEAIRVRPNKSEDLKLSYVIFSRERSVPFLDGHDHKDLNHGFLLFVEIGDFAFTFHSKATLAADLLTKK